MDVMHVSKLMDFTGQKIGRLTVIERDVDRVAPNGRRRTAWICQCECGKIISVRGESLSKTNHQTQSCGCLSSDLSRESHTRHGKSKSKLYAVWNGIKARCYNPNNTAYKNYGARGISVCDEWREHYEEFEAWALSSGYSSGLSIDRIDVNGNYSPDNCRWADASLQASNRRSNRIIRYNGEEHTLTQWAQILNLPPKTLFSRVYAGHSIEEILSTNNNSK